MARTEIQEAKRWVIKIGSAVLTDDGRGLDRASIQHWVEQIVELRQRGIEIVLVSSGAVAEGMSRLGWKNRPEALHELQAAAAIARWVLCKRMNPVSSNTVYTPRKFYWITMICPIVSVTSMLAAQCRH